MTTHSSERRSLARAQRRTNQSGAAMTEYALLLFAVTICAAGAIKLIGPSVGCAGLSATESLPGVSEGGGGCGGATASASGAGGSSGGASGGSSAGSSSGANGSAADEIGASAGGAGSGSSGYIASATTYDDGAGGFIGGSGSSNGGLASGNSADLDPGAAPPSSASVSVGGGGGGGGSFGGESNVFASSSFASNGNASSGSGLGGLATVGAGGGGGGGSSWGNGGASAPSKNGPEDQYASEGDNFSEKTAGKKPQKGDLILAKLSKDAEATKQKGADGYYPLTNKQLEADGIKPSLLKDNFSKFAATIYTNGKGDYVVAYRGTQFTSLPGPYQDVMQGAGLNTLQFSEGARLAKAAKNAFGGNVVFTGHSLGGALADQAAAITGSTAVTFNASGTNDNTFRRDGIDPATARADAANGQSRAYEVRGEIVTTSQNLPGSVLPQSTGTKIVIQDPDLALTKSDLAKSNVFNADMPIINRSIALHSDWISGMEKNPVKYGGANGTTDELSFSNPPHP